MTQSTPQYNFQSTQKEINKPRRWRWTPRTDSMGSLPPNLPTEFSALNCVTVHILILFLFFSYAPMDMSLLLIISDLSPVQETESKLVI